MRCTRAAARGIQTSAISIRRSTSRPHPTAAASGERADGADGGGEPGSLALPLYSHMTSDQVDRVCQEVESLLA